MLPPDRENIRQKRDPLKLSSFLDFITSSHIIKDLPFGEKRLKLSSGEVMDVPNIIREKKESNIISPPYEIISNYLENKAKHSNEILH